MRFRRSKLWGWLAPALLLVLAGAGVALLIGRAGKAPRVSGWLPQKIYVWQRAWRPEVGQGIDRAAPTAAGFVVLGAEIAWRNGVDRPPTVVRPPIDFAALRRAGCPVGIALRVGAHPGPFGAEEPADLLTHLAEELRAKAKAADVPIQQWQIDYDCAASKLDDYARWVGVLRKRLPDAPLAVTALPSWLKRQREFGALARAAGCFVLQVHSLSPPSDAAEPLVLCDPQLAREAVEAAARFGVPFAVALPTYTYVASFDGAGKLRGLYAEGGVPASAVAEKGAHLRMMRADAGEMAALVAAWSRDRPAVLREIFWYRLPVDGDQFNWRWPTLAAVMVGRSPRVSLSASVRWPDADRLAEVDLVNDGEADAPLPPEWLAEWSPPDILPLAADGANGWMPDANISRQPGRLRFTRRAGPDDATLPAGERQTVGWIRFERTVENLRIQLKTNSP